MTTQKKDNKVTTPVFRTSFASVFQPRKINENNPNEVAKYSITMLFKKTDDISVLKNAVRAAVTEKWGADKTKWPKNLVLPFRDGAEKDFDGYGPDMIFVQASSKMKPGVVDQDLQPIITPDGFYSGCFAKATVNAFCWEFMGKKGVSFGLRNIQFVKDGDRFGGGTKAENDFDKIEVPAGSDGGSKAEPVEDDGLGL